MEFENTVNLKEALTKNNLDQQEDYTNPEDDKSIEKNQAPQYENGFKPLSRFSQEQNIHMLSLGIQLSSNHPVIKDNKFLTDIQEKIKGLSLSSDKNCATI